MKELVEKIIEIEVRGLKSYPSIFKKFQGPKIDRKSLNYFPGF